MSTKNKILELLERNRGKKLSGEEIAGLLNISRSSVWKAVNSLKKEGYEITAVTNSGYALSIDNNIVSVEGMMTYLASRDYVPKIHIYKSLESTNKTAKELAINGAEHGTVVIAESQTKGRGRYGRSFYSPPESGLYMSFILRSQFLELPTITLITAYTAVAVCRAIEHISKKQLTIKWVNDILLNGRKIGGILTEAITDFESGSIDWIVVGIGLNVSTAQENFPAELYQSAGSIFSEKIEGATRNCLAAEIINRILPLGTCDQEMFNEYKKRLTMLGSKITISQPNLTFEATAIDVDSNGRLLVEKDDGMTVALSTSEVSIKV